MPASKDPGKNISELSKAHPDWPKKKRIAAGLNMAREKGAKIPPKKR